MANLLIILLFIILTCTTSCGIKIISSNNDYYSILDQGSKSRVGSFKPVNKDHAEFLKSINTPFVSYYIHESNLKQEFAKNKFTWVILHQSPCRLYDSTFLRWIPYIDSLSQFNEVAPYFINTYFNIRSLYTLKQSKVYPYFTYCLDTIYGHKNNQKIEKFLNDFKLKTDLRASFHHIIFNQQGEVIFSAPEHLSNKKSLEVYHQKIFEDIKRLFQNTKITSQD